MSLNSLDQDQDGKFETDSIKNQFMELVLAKHSNVAFVQMIKRDTGIVFLKPDRRVKSYCLLFGLEGFELLEIDPTPLLDLYCSAKK